MTHEELVEKVCRGLAHQHMTASGTSYTLHWSLFKKQACTAIKIVGEACAELCTSKVPHYSTNELIEDSTGGKHSGAVYAKSILSLTQGTKE